MSRDPNQGCSDEEKGLSGLTSLERRLFGRIIRAQFQTSQARFERSLKRFGPVGAARLVASYLWVTPVWFIIIAIIVVGLVGRTHHPDEEIVLLVLIGCSCMAVAILRFVTALRAGMRFRNLKGATHRPDSTN